jgi:hypothetical protein
VRAIQWRIECYLSWIEACLIVFNSRFDPIGLIPDPDAELPAAARLWKSAMQISEIFPEF